MKIRSHLTKKKMSKIRYFAINSLFRTNAYTCDCYAFSLTDDGTEWIGGWDWENALIDDTCEYIYRFKTNEFVRNER